MGVAGLSVLAHVPTPLADSPLHVTWGQKKHSLHSPTIPLSRGLGLAHSHAERGSASSCAPFGGILHRLITLMQRVVLSPLLTHRNSALVFLTQGAGEIVAVTQDSRVQEPFTLGAVCLCVPYRFRWYVYVSLSIVAVYVVYCGLRLCFPLSTLGV